MFTLSDLKHNQPAVTGVFPLPPPRYVPSFLSCIVFSTPSFTFLCSLIFVEFCALKFCRVCGFRVRVRGSYRTSRSFGYGYESVPELPEVPGIMAQAYRTHRSSRRVQNMLYPYPVYCGTGLTELTKVSFVNPFRAPEPLPVLNPSNFVPKNGIPVVKGLRR